MAGIFPASHSSVAPSGIPRTWGKRRRKSKVWFYENGRAPRLELVKDIGGEPYVYSELPTDDAKTLDEKITDYETIFDRNFRQLKATPAGQAVDSGRRVRLSPISPSGMRTIRQIFSLGLGVDL